MTDLTIFDNDIQVKTHAIPSYVAYIDLEVTEKDFLKPSFWVHVLRNFQTDDKKMLGAEIIIYKRDYSYRADLVVTDITSDGLVVAMIGEHNLSQVEENEAVEADGYRKVFIPGNKAYNIVRKSDNKTVFEKLTKDAVELKLSELNG